MSKFTKGPWFRLSNATGTGFHLTTSVGADWADDTHYIGEVRTIGNEANARLIAAAPELYEACWEIFKYESNHSRLPKKYWKMMKQALAKVEGRE